jgi:hypothetical protein
VGARESGLWRLRHSSELLGAGGGCGKVVRGDSGAEKRQCRACCAGLPG